jgi:hypothetical protein
MPYTEQQRKLFHAAEENPEVAREHGMSRREAGKLADEADRLKRQGREKAAKGIGFVDLTPVLGRRGA